MRIALLTNIVSPHQLPLAEEIVKRVGDGNYRYVFTEKFHAERAKMGWGNGAAPSCCVDEQAGRDFLEHADVVYCGNRDLELFARRLHSGLKSFYMSERWFKPWIGMLRLLKPSYFRMAWRFVQLLRTSGKLFYFPMGIHAARDMARLCGLFAGDMRCLFRAPQLDFERKPGGKIWLKNGGDGKRYCLDKMRMWGYFVEPSRFDALSVQEAADTPGRTCRVLWVGRLLNWKRVDTIVRAVGEHANLKRVDTSLPAITLDIYGTGPEELRLKKLAAEYGDAIKFFPPVPIAEVRRLMREHDVYVLSSNGYEGWGAVVSEALEEGMKVLGTYEAGSSATILPEECLFHAGDWRALLRRLQGEIPQVGIGDWTAKDAAEKLLHIDL